jgi:hypothetical protein
VRPRWFALAVAALVSLTGAWSTHADGSWVLWTRTCSVKAQPCGAEWRKRQTYEAERWCRAARTTLINQAFSQEAQELTAARGTLIDYQCLPESVDPREAKGK